MKLVNVHEAKTQLSKYLEEVEAGKEIVIGRYGRPVARLVPFVPEKAKYRLGLLKGKLKMADHFDGSSGRVDVMFGERA